MPLPRRRHEVCEAPGQAHPSDHSPFTPTSRCFFCVVQGGRFTFANHAGGGGGGAGAAAVGLNGGAGMAINFDGNLRFYAGGGGGGLGRGVEASGSSRGGLGGSQVGGVGGRQRGFPRVGRGDLALSAVPAVANTGSGAGGSGDSIHPVDVACIGSAGLVMVRWRIF